MKRRRLAIMASLSVTALALAVLPLALAVLPGSDFEGNDGNLAVDTAGNTDWNSFDPVTWAGTAPTRVGTSSAAGWDFKGFEDWQATTSDSGFAGGTKQDDICPTLVTAKAPNKGDLKRIYLASKTGSNGHTFLSLAWVRIPQNTTSPSAHVAFEFNKGNAGNCTGSPLVNRVAGDMLVVYDFEGGTDTPVISLSRWVTSGACEVGSHSAPCWSPQDTLDASEAEAAVNTGGAVTDAIGPVGSESLGTKEFGEAAIDLTAAGVFNPGECETFGKALGVSRTSGSSSTAQMKDLVGPVTSSSPTVARSRSSSAPTRVAWTRRSRSRRPSPAPSSTASRTPHRTASRSTTAPARTARPTPRTASTSRRVATA